MAGMGKDFQPVIKVDEYFGFALKVLLGIAATFETPTLVFLLSKMGILTAKWMIKNFKYAVLAIFVIAAVITPTPDWVTQSIVAIPMLALYGLSILIALLVGRQKTKAAASEETPAGEMSEKARVILRKVPGYGPAHLHEVRVHGRRLFFTWCRRFVKGRF